MKAPQLPSWILGLFEYPNFAYLAIVLGTCLIFIYFFIKFRQRKEVSFLNIVVVFMTSTTLLFGFRICLIALDANFVKTYEDMSIVVFLAGLLVIFASFTGIIQVVQVPKQGDL